MSRLCARSVVSGSTMAASTYKVRKLSEDILKLLQDFKVHAYTMASENLQWAAPRSPLPHPLNHHILKVGDTP